MAKQSRKKLRRPKRRSFRKRTRKMVGGDFTQEESQQLLGMGFSQQDIEVLAATGVGLNIIQMSLNQVNPATGAPFTPQELIQSVNEANEEINQLDISGISNASEDDHNLDDGQNLNDSYNDSMNTTSEETNLNNSNVFNGNNNSQDSLHLSDLNVSADNSSTNTTMEDNSFGGKRGKTRKGRKGRKYGRKSRKQRGGTVFSEEQLTELGNLGFTDAQKKVLSEVMNEIDSNSKMILIRHNVQQIDPRTGQVITIQQFMDDIADSPDVGGGKRRRKSRKQRGGVCYGNGVGANNYDPNFSIYNTRELTLFPYRPTN
jgi:hypothetical protein